MLHGSPRQASERHRAAQRPLRAAAGAAASPATPAGRGEGHAAGSPGPGNGGGARLVSTPEQLQRYMARPRPRAVVDARSRALCWARTMRRSRALRTSSPSTRTAGLGSLSLCWFEACKRWQRGTVGAAGLPSGRTRRSILAGRGKAASWGRQEGCALRVVSAAGSPRERRGAARRAHSPAERGALAQPDGRPAHKADARAWSSGHAASSLDARRGSAGVGRAQAASGAGAAPARTRQGGRPPPPRRALTGAPAPRAAQDAFEEDAAALDQAAGGYLPPAAAYGGAPAFTGAQAAGAFRGSPAAGGAPPVYRPSLQVRRRSVHSRLVAAVCGVRSVRGCVSCGRPRVRGSHGLRWAGP